MFGDGERIESWPVGEVPESPISSNLCRGDAVLLENRKHNFLRVRLLAAIVALCGLIACSPPKPIRLGFVGGLSGRVADLGVEGRNGAALAVEMRNKAGGVNGRRVELLAEDDQQNADQLRRAVERLIGLPVDAIIGPMTSAMAMAAVPLTNEARVVMVSPTVSTKDLSGIDDYFFRVVAATDVNVVDSANYHYRKVGLRRVGAVYDLNNRSYTLSWIDEYRKAFVALGGELVDSVGFSSGSEVRFADLARKVLLSQPDGVMIVANSVDTAMLCQHLRRLDAQVRIVVTDWAATEQLVELGGRAVEGVVVTQYFDRRSTKKSYVDFRRNYLERYAREPGYAGLTAFDATTTVLDAMAGLAPGQTLKDALLARKSFPGIDGEVVFDAFGDGSRASYFSMVKDGVFVRQP